MSVIAKLYVQTARNYGAGSLSQLHCVAENDMMAAYADSEEDRLFTRYSPSGDVKLHHDSGWAPFDQDGEKFYFLILNAEEAGNRQFPGAVAYRALQVFSLTDFGHDAKRLEMREHAAPTSTDFRERRIGKFSWQMTIDNPGLMDSGFLEPGRSDYWLVIYPAGEFTRDKAIAAAHGGVDA